MFWTCKPVLRCRLSRGAFSLGKPQGVRISEWRGNGEGWKRGDQFTSNLGVYFLGPPSTVIANSLFITGSWKMTWTWIKETGGSSTV
jgi:hypothetical protein